MKIKTETLPSYRIAYMRRVGAYSQANHELMEKLKRWARDKKLLGSAPVLAIAQDHPETTPPEQCRFDACIVINDDFQVDDAVQEGRTYGGKYLILEVEHTAKHIQEAYAQLFNVLQLHRYEIDNKPIIERYSGDVLDTPYCEICVPIKV